MNIMGSALERSAGNKLENMIGKLTTGKMAGFVWSDLISNMERVSDHCSNIAGCVMDAKEQTVNLHESLKHLRSDNADYRAKYAEYTQKYLSFV